MARFVGEGQEFDVTLRSDDQAHAELFSAFEYGSTLVYSLRSIGRALPEQCFMQLIRDEDKETFVLPGFRRDGVCEFTVRTNEICPKNEKSGLFYCRFEIGEICVAFSESEDGYLVGGADDPAVCFQLSVYRPQTNRPTGYEGGIMYQIFPDRFRRGGGEFHKEGAVIEEDWYAPVSEFAEYPGAPLKNNHFFGGTLYGIAEKLDYLLELGVTVLYLNPIFRAASNHRYDTGDYERVDELLGGDDALAYLIAECRKKGVSIILDGVFNHTGSDSRYFNKYGHYDTVGAYQSKDSPYADWYCFTDFPDKYECWWGIDILPKVNSAQSSYKEYVTAPGGIVDRYLKMGVSGWRLDVADELPDVMLDAIAERAKAHSPASPIIGEVWEDASNKVAYSKRRHYFTRGQLTSVMNYPLKNAIIDYLTIGDAKILYGTMKTLYGHYPKSASDMAMNILSSHDTPRILNMLAGSPHEGMSAREMAYARLTDAERALALRRLRLALVLQMFLPGIPCIYYGDEIAMEGDRDPFNRQTYKWGREDEETLSVYRHLTSLRKSLPMLGGAWYRGVEYRNGVFAFERFDEKRRLYVAVCLSDAYDTPDLGRGRMLYPQNADVSGSIRLTRDESCCILYDF